MVAISDLGNAWQYRDHSGSLRPTHRSSTAQYLQPERTRTTRVSGLRTQRSRTHDTGLGSEVSRTHHPRDAGLHAHPVEELSLGGRRDLLHAEEVFELVEDVVFLARELAHLEDAALHLGEQRAEDHHSQQHHPDAQHLLRAANAPHPIRSTQRQVSTPLPTLLVKLSLKQPEHAHSTLVYPRVRSAALRVWDIPSNTRGNAD
eukprot:2847097-Rhodomonas_salina.3